MPSLIAGSCFYVIGCFIGSPNCLSHSPQRESSSCVKTECKGFPSGKFCPEIGFHHKLSSFLIFRGANSGPLCSALGGPSRASPALHTAGVSTCKFALLGLFQVGSEDTWQHSSVVLTKTCSAGARPTYLD